VSVDQDLIDWIDGEIEKKRFASRSHATDYILSDWIAEEKKKEKG
jgi:Arc/MetJ-type ribon-helix-helix transcriptional regulator